MQVSARIPTTAQAVYFIEKVRELHLLRELIKVATGAVERCFSYQGGLEEFIDGVEQDIFRVTQDRISDAAKPMKEPTREAVTVINKLMMKKGEKTGVVSGFKDLDDLTFGFQKQEMIVLAARPSVGKTSLALNVAESAALPKKGEPGAHADLFAGDELLAARAAHAVRPRQGEHQAAARRLLSKNGQEQQELLQAADEFSKSPLFIDDSSHLTIMELRAKARRLYSRHKLGLIVDRLPPADQPERPEDPARAAGGGGAPADSRPWRRNSTCPSLSSVS